MEVNHKSDYMKLWSNLETLVHYTSPSGLLETPVTSHPTKINLKAL